MNNECIFCKIIKGEIPCYKIYEDEKCLAFLDISADCLGHTLVVSKTHTNNFVETNSDILNTLFCTTQKIAKHYITNCGFDGVQIVINNGESSGQSVMHTHFHILPSVKKENKKFDTIQKTDLNFVQSQLAMQ